MMMNVKRHIRVLLAAVVLSVCSTSVYPTWWGNNRQWVIGAGIGVGVSVALNLGLVMPRVLKLRFANKKSNKKLREQVLHLQNNLAKLQSEVDAFPYSDFIHKADEKIAQVRKLLSKDLSEHRNTLCADVDAVAQEIAQLRIERDKMIHELDRQHSFLGQVHDFVASVRDHQGTAFLNNLVAAKNEVEGLLARLSDQRRHIAGQLDSLQQTSSQQKDMLATQQQSINTINSEVQNINMMIAQRREQLNQAQALSHEMDQEVGSVQDALRRGQQQYESLKASLHQALANLTQYVEAAKHEKSSLEKKVHNVTYLIEDLSTRINSLHNQANRHGARLSQELSNSQSSYTAPRSSSSKPSSYSSDHSSSYSSKSSSRPRSSRHTTKPSSSSTSHKPTSSSTPYQSNKPSNSYSSEYAISSYNDASGSSWRESASSSSGSVQSDADVILAAVANLKKALQPFAAGDFSDTGWRKAFLKFARKNHPDKGGSSVVYQAVDGLYKLLKDRRLLSRVPSDIPASLRRELTAGTQSVKAIISKIKH